MRLAFDDWGIHRVFAQLDPRNDASAPVCQRLGMRQEAQPREESWFTGEWGDVAIFGLLAGEWQRQRR